MCLFGNYKKIDEHELSLKIVRKEGKKDSVNIAQIKEIQKIMLEELAEELGSGNKKGIIELIRKHSVK
jgi:hypothetical protein